VVLGVSNRVEAITFDRASDEVDFVVIHGLIADLITILRLANNKGPLPIIIELRARSSSSSSSHDGITSYMAVETSSSDFRHCGSHNVAAGCCVGSEERGSAVMDEARAVVGATVVDGLNRWLVEADGRVVDLDRVAIPGLVDDDEVGPETDDNDAGKTVSTNV